MSTNRMKIEVNALKEGMFVADLDRPWHETPFPLQGFYIRLDDDVKALSEYCKFVYVDQKKQRQSKNYEKHAEFDKKGKVNSKTEKKEKAQVIELPPIVIKSPQRYECSESIHKEVSK